jgi:hypothetical protein
MAQSPYSDAIIVAIAKATVECPEGNERSALEKLGPLQGVSSITDGLGLCLCVRYLMVPVNTPEITTLSSPRSAVRVARPLPEMRPTP